MPPLLAPPRRTPPEDKYPDKAPGLPPPTPRPTTLPPQKPQPPRSNNDDQDTEGKTLVLQPPPQPKKDPGKRSREDGPDPGPSGPKKGELGPDLDQHPVEGSTNESEAEVPTEGGGGDQDQGPDQPPREGASGEGDVEGHPPLPPSQPPALHPPPSPPPPNGENGEEESQGLVPTVASLLAMWENQFNQLVEDIKEDLEDYWRKLMTPQ